MATVKVTDASFEQDVLQSAEPVVVDFWAEWCGPCRMVGPVLDSIAEEHDSVKVVKVNVDDNPATAGQFRVMSIPTLILFKDGQPVETMVGAQPKRAFETMLDKHAGVAAN